MTKPVHKVTAAIHTLIWSLGIGHCNLQAGLRIIWSHTDLPGNCNEGISRSQYHINHHDQIQILKYQIKPGHLSWKASSPNRRLNFYKLVFLRPPLINPHLPTLNTTFNPIFEGEETKILFQSQKSFQAEHSLLKSCSFLRFEKGFSQMCWAWTGFGQTSSLFWKIGLSVFTFFQPSSLTKALLII